MGFENGQFDLTMDVTYNFGVDDANDSESKKSRTSLVTCACTFCKKRHLKCDGQLPCSNCVSKKQGDQCAYPQQAKRGRKPAPQPTPPSNQLAAYKFSNSLKNAPEPENVPNGRDSNLLMELMKLRQEAEFWKQQYFREHEKCIAMQLQVSAPPVKETSIQLMQLSASIFFRSAATKLQAILPFYVSVVDSDFPWHNFQGIRCDSYRPGLIAPEELINALEYAAICAMGSIEHNIETSVEFANKAEDFLYILFWKEMIHKNENLAYRAFKVILTYTSYWWLNLNPLKAQLIAQLALLLWHAHQHVFPPVWCYQLFGILATSSKAFDERLRWVSSMRATMDRLSEPAENLTCLQMAFATSLSFVKWSSPGSLTELEKQTLLQFLELLNGTYCSKWVISERSRIVLAACKSLVFLHLGNEQSALEFCRETFDRFDCHLKVDLGMLLALAAVAKVHRTITKEEIPEMYRDLMAKNQTQYPVIRDLLNQFKGIPPEFMRTLNIPIPGTPAAQVQPWCEPVEPPEKRVTDLDSSSSSSPIQVPLTPTSSFDTESPPSIQDWQFLLAALSQQPN